MSKFNAAIPAAFAKVEEEMLPEACQLRAELADKLAVFEEQARTNHLQSPVRNMALYVSGLLQGGRVDFSGLSDLVQLLTANAFHYRAQKLHGYIGECSADENENTLKRTFEKIAHDENGALLSYADFAAKVERDVFGVVFTAHPTFSVSKELTRILAEMAVRDDETGDVREGLSRMAGVSMADLAKQVIENKHGSSDRIALDDEMEFALMAIDNIRRALRRVYGVLFSVARELYPSDWLRLTPKLLSVATWIGYDLDGRSDITWADTLRKRMTVEQLALTDYRDALADFDQLADVRERMESMLALLEGDIRRLQVNPDSIEDVGAFSRPLAESLESRLTDLGWVIGRITTEMESQHDHLVALAVLRAEMANFGLAYAQTHVRINATQISNAIRSQIDLTSSPEDPANRRRYLREISELLNNVEPLSINFGSVMRERTSAKRMVMLVAQFLKYVDSREPVRFLIAECNTAFTVLTALYFAKLFGIDDKIDISPLFETSTALEQGHEIMAELLDNETYVAYVRKRGRMCIQTGFSDAGRYIGQVPASLAIERIRIKLADIIKSKGMQGVELLIFDTHGESIGRGTHPLSFSDRLDFIYPPHARMAFKKAGVRVKQEMSFQGGDGYVYFANADLAFATVTRLVEHALSGTPEEDVPDLFYEDHDFALDFFMSVKGFNERLMNNPDYATTLDLFGTNLLYPTGSRKVKRQHEGGRQVDLDHPSQVRAIPHNAILQQLGYLSNSISGLGKAISRDEERFVKVFERSDRLRRFMSLAAYARHLSNLDALHGYISLFDPTIWIRRSTVETNPARVKQMRHLAHILRHSSRHEKMNRVYRIFLNDTVYLDHGLEVSGARDMLPASAAKCYPDLMLLHGVRIALIHEIFLLVARIPKFTNQEESSEDVINELLRLNVDHAIAVLRRGFPVSQELADSKAFGEKATYRTDVEQGYEREHRDLFDPLEELYDVLRRASTGIAHMTGAVG